MLLVLVTALVSTLGTGVPAVPASAEADVRAAIVRAVRERVGECAVTVDALQVRGLTATTGVRAVPDAGSRLGGPVRFILHAGGPHGERFGSADAVVSVRIAHVRAAHAIAPGVVLAPGDLASVDGDPGRVAFAKLPAAATLVGARTRRAIAADGAIATDAVSASPLVRRGDEIGTAIRIGSIVASGRATALDDGQLGEFVRVQVDRRRLRGRVTAIGEVEITP
jgi:flagella basal body P-ring formation protein FlgA